MRATLMAAVAIALLAPLPARAEPVTIRADWAVIPGQFAPLIPTLPNYAPGLYRHYGKSYIVEPIKL
jgi:hypothetical protein